MQPQPQIWWLGVILWGFMVFFFLFLTVLLTFQSRPQWKRCYPKINGNSLCPKDWDAGQNLLTQQVSKIASLGNKTSKLTYIQSSLFSFGQCEAKLHRCSDATSFTAGVAHLTCPLPLDYSNDLPRAQNPLQASSRFLSHYKKETKKERNNVKNLLQIYLIIKSKEWGYAGGRCCAVIRTETAQTKMKVCDHSQQAGHVVQVCMYRSFRVSWSSQVQVLQEPSTMAPERLSTWRLSSCSRVWLQVLPKPKAPTSQAASAASPTLYSFTSPHQGEHHSLTIITNTGQILTLSTNTISQLPHTNPPQCHSVDQPPALLSATLSRLTKYSANLSETPESENRLYQDLNCQDDGWLDWFPNSSCGKLCGKYFC